MPAPVMPTAVGLATLALVAAPLYAGAVVDAAAPSRSVQAARPNLDITAMRVRVRDDGTSFVRLRLTNAGGRRANDARVRLEDNGRFVRVSSGFNLPAHTSQVLLIGWPTKHKHGRHRLVAIADPQDIVAESSERDNRAARVVRLP